MLKQKEAQNFLNTYFSAVFLLLTLCFSVVANADDPGIHKARLIQQNDSLYIFEVDASPNWVWAIKDPIFPSRCEVSSPQYINKGTWTVIRVQIRSKGPSLNSADNIFLPWIRNGADFTAIWKDGSVFKGLFIRDVEGITVPLKQLMPITINKVALYKEQINAALIYLRYSLCFVLLAFVLVLNFKGIALKRALIVFLLSQGTSLVLSNWGISGFSLVLTTLLILAYTFILSVFGVKPKYERSQFGIIATLGVLIGLSYFGEINVLNLDTDFKIVLQFIFLLCLSLGVLVLVLMAYLIFRAFNLHAKTRIVNYVMGSLAVAAILAIFSNDVKHGDFDILGLQQSDYSKRVNNVLSDSNPMQNTKSVGKAELTTPVMSFLTIEPFEIRHEILINARTAVKLLGVNDTGKAGIPVNSLEQVKEGIGKFIAMHCRLHLNNNDLKPDITNTDFVTLSSSGVLVRDKPVAESLDTGIIGITLVYEVNKYPENVSVHWKLLSSIVPSLETTSIDPFSTNTAILTADNATYTWENELYSVPNTAIKSVDVKQRQIAYISYVILIVCVILLLLKVFKKKPIKNNVFAVLLTVAFLTFPFLRFHLNLPYLSQITPSEAQTKTIIERLMTNVYKSFEVRNESKVYDRLALSVTGEKLTEIYLENRKSLEFENRGGARANIDDVQIKFVGGIKRVAHNTFVARAEWMANGSVGHFGHTHYRRNWYNALITFTIDNNNWKIKNLELVEEKRLL